MKTEQKNAPGNGQPKRFSSKELYGVVNFLKKQNMPMWQDVLKAYNAQVLKMEPQPGQQFVQYDAMAQAIQKDFGAFATYIRNAKKQQQ